MNCQSVVLPYPLEEWKSGNETVTPSLQLQEAKELVKDAIRAGIFNDLVSNYVSSQQLYIHFECTVGVCYIGKKFV